MHDWRESRTEGGKEGRRMDSADSKSAAVTGKSKLSTIAAAAAAAADDDDATMVARTEGEMRDRR